MSADRGADSHLPHIGLADLQASIRETYFDRDRERGLERTFLWLVEEVGELAREVNSDDRDDERLRLEVSDVLAWLISVANLLDIDVASAASRFDGGCPKCGAKPCRCIGRG
jgi:NTP pyrophosphatase (non-canonical NTP hydrolase)